MRVTSTPRKNRWSPERSVNPRIVEARARERYWHEFRIEMELIGARLRRLRMDQGYSLVYLAQVIGIPKRRLYQIECGRYKHFATPHLHTLCWLYGTTQADVLDLIPDGL